MHFLVGVAANTSPNFFGGKSQDFKLKPVGALQWGRWRLSTGGGYGLMGQGRRDRGSGAQAVLRETDDFNLSLSLNIDRDPKALWVGDNAAEGDTKPLVEVDKASFLVGSKLPGVMTARSKVAYGNADAAKASQVANGGELTDFDGALLAAYTDMSADVARIRKNRAERRRKMMEQQNKS